MAPSSGDIYKNYFNDSTLSDLTIRLSDRTVYVHRIILCSRSKYFNKLILNGFKESGLKEIALHGDDPTAMIVLLRHIYDLPYVDLLKDSKTKLQFLAQVYLAADKYQLEELQANVIKLMRQMTCMPTVDMYGMYEYSYRLNDFLEATDMIFDGTVRQDDVCRVALIEVCVLWIHDLNKLSRFSLLLREHADLGARILAHEGLSLNLQGSWFCDNSEDKCAVPCCVGCEDPFDVSYIHEHREEDIWECIDCGSRGRPVCLGKDSHEKRVDCRWYYHDD